MKLFFKISPQKHKTNTFVLIFMYIRNIGVKNLLARIWNGSKLHLKWEYLWDKWAPTNKSENIKQIIQNINEFYVRSKTPKSQTRICTTIVIKRSACKQLNMWWFFFSSSSFSSCSVCRRFLCKENICVDAFFSLCTYVNIVCTVVFFLTYYHVCGFINIDCIYYIQCHNCDLDLMPFILCG